MNGALQAYTVILEKSSTETFYPHVTPVPVAKAKVASDANVRHGPGTDYFLKEKVLKGAYVYVLETLLTDDPDYTLWARTPAGWVWMGNLQVLP